MRKSWLVGDWDTIDYISIWALFETRNYSEKSAKKKKQKKIEICFLGFFSVNITLIDFRGGLLSRFKCVRILRSENPFSPETTKGVRISTVITRAKKKLTLVQLAAMVLKKPRKV